jgi:hypothetical protein
LLTLKDLPGTGQNAPTATFPIVTTMLGGFSKRRFGHTPICAAHDFTELTMPNANPVAALIVLAN